MSLGPELTFALLAVGLSVQPWSVLAAFLLAAAARGAAKALSFVLGWVLAILVFGFLGVLLDPQLPAGSASVATLDVVDLGVGLVFAAWLALRWRHPPTSTGPRWSGRLDRFSPVTAFALGAFLPNYLMVVAAASQLLQMKLGTTGLVLGVIAFAVIASLGVAAPLVLLLTVPHRAAELNQRLRTWLSTHSRPLMFSLGSIIAGLLIGKGLWGLLS